METRAQGPRLKRTCCMCCQGAQASMQSDKDMIDNLVREEDGEGPETG